MAEIEIKPFTADASEEILNHFQRHRRESGQDGVHFMPFAPDDPHGPQGISIEKAFLPLDTIGWQRWFYARDISSGKIVGHVDLKGDGLRAGLHRCDLGIGIETAYRGAGLGKRLMMTAIDFARSVDSLAWIDLKVFAQNRRAYALYKQLGFTEVGILRDRFRIEGESLDDVVMVLNVG